MNSAFLFLWTGILQRETSESWIPLGQVLENVNVPRSKCGSWGEVALSLKSHLLEKKKRVYYKLRLLWSHLAEVLAFAAGYSLLNPFTKECMPDTHMCLLEISLIVAYSFTWLNSKQKRWPSNRDVPQFVSQKVWKINCIGVNYKSPSATGA